MSSSPLEFDVRRDIQGAESDGEDIQAVYDNINRLVFLIGDISFMELFTTPMSSLCSRLRSKVDSAPEELFPRRRELKEVLGRLDQQHETLTLLDCAVSSRREVSQQALSRMIELRRLGIRAPIPALDETDQSQRLELMNELVFGVGHYSYKDLFVKTAVEAPDLAAAHQKVKQAGLLFSWHCNDRCCGGPAGSKSCQPMDGAFCQLLVRRYGGALCSASSTMC